MEDTNRLGAVTLRTNRFTVVENGLHYLDNGVWKESEDLLESFPGGAVARRGPHQAIFSTDLAGEAVFDVLASDGVRLRGRFLGLRLTDGRSGQSVVVASVKPSTRGVIDGADRVVYADALDGLEGDLVYVWRHNYFSQDVVLRTAPPLPEGFDPQTTRLEAVTEFLEVPEPKIVRSASPAGDRADAEAVDESVIDFGRLAIVVGKAFRCSVADATGLGTLSPDRGLRVSKQWQALPDGRALLVESLAWADATVALGGLPAAAGTAKTAASPTGPEPFLLRPGAAGPSPSKAPMALAQAPYVASGYVLDFIILPTSPQTTTFFTDQTYYVKTRYYMGSAVTFQPNCTIKFKNNAYMLLYGTVSFPSSGAPAVFTSRNDDLFGEKIAGVPQEPDSDGDASQHRAAQALWIYYVSFATEVRNARIRWAQRGVQYDANPGVYVYHTLRDTSLEHSQTGVYLNLPNGSLTLTNVKKCNVVTAVSGSGYWSGTMVDDCGVQNISHTANHQKEPAIAVVEFRDAQNNPKTNVVVIARHTLPNGEPALLRMTSGDFGSTWDTPTVIADGTFGTPPMYKARNDPALAADGYGNLFLTYLTRSPPGVPDGVALYVSTDGGMSFLPAPNFYRTGMHDFPRVCVGPSGTGTQSVWVSLFEDPYMRVWGTEVRGKGVINLGPNWTTTTFINDGSYRSVMSSCAVGPSGEVAVSYVEGGPSRLQAAPVGLWTFRDLDGLGSGSGFVGGQSFQIDVDWEQDGLYCQAGYAIHPIPVLAWDRIRNRLYVAYPDRPTPTSGADIDIYVRWSDNAGATWSERKRVNDDSTARTQFHPQVAVATATGKVGVLWYDCRLDPANTLTYEFFAVSQDGFASPSPRNFRLNPQPSNAGNLDSGAYAEYIGLASHKGLFFPVWVDCSNVPATNPDGTTRLDVHACAVAY